MNKEGKMKLSRWANTFFAITILVALCCWPGTAQAESDSTFDRIKKTGVVRVAGLVGEEPYFHKDLSTGKWSGFCIEMARDIAKNFGAKLEIVESTWGNSVLDLQANKIDISFALNPTPKRALVIDFTRPIFYNSFSIVTRKGFTVKSWSELNRPEVKIGVDIGSTHELIARRYTPNANIIGFKSRDEVIMAVQAGKADCFVCTIILGLTSLKKNPELGTFIIPEPVLSVPVSAGVRKEPDKSWRDWVSVWADYNRGLGTTREFIIESLKDVGIKLSDVPPQVQF
jgi:polar amino acid transport system substrate-binding protein